MAIAASNLTNDASATDGLSFVTGSVTIVSGRAYLFSFAVYNTASTQPVSPSSINNSGGNGAVPWTLVGYNNFDTIAANMGTLFVYGGVATASGSTTVTVNFSFTNHAFAWSIDEFTGASTTTPFPQYVANADNVSPETTGTLGTMVDSNSRSFVAFGKNTNVASVYTLETNWALLAEASTSPPTLHITTAWSSAAGADTSTSATQTTGTQAAGSMLVEIAANQETNVSLTATAGAYSFDGASPVVAASGEPNIVVPAGAFSFAGTAPTIAAATGIDISAPAGQFSFGGAAPTLEGTLTEDSGGSSLSLGYGTYGYLSPNAEKSLKDR